MTEKWTEGKKNCDIRFFIFFYTGLRERSALKQANPTTQSCRLSSAETHYREAGKWPSLQEKKNAVNQCCCVISYWKNVFPAPQSRQAARCRGDRMFR